MTQNKAQQRLKEIEKEVGIVRQKLQGGFLLNLNPLNLLEKEKQGILLGIEETKKEILEKLKDKKVLAYPFINQSPQWYIHLSDVEEVLK